MPKVVDHVLYRKQLLTQCLDLFAHYGYSGLTMRQIAEELHVSTGTLYHYFSTKEELFQLLVEDVTQQIVFEAASMVQHYATLEERLWALCRFLEQHEDSFQKQFLIMLNYYQHRDVYGSSAGSLLKQGGERYRQLIQDLIGLHDPQLCFLLQCQIHGLFTLRMMNGKHLPFLEQLDLIVDMIMEALHKRSVTTEGSVATGKEDIS